MVGKTYTTKSLSTKEIRHLRSLEMWWKRYHSWSYREIAVMYNLSQERTRQVLNRVERSLG
jgi:DNA-directed RNA polymerase sigma subunit (sigma70/sigma32)